MLIEREARLLDQLKFDEWLAMYAPECIYWVPATPQGGDPRREVAILFDDRRRMEDRIYRLRTGYAWSQAPKSRTVRMVSNVEVFAAGAARMVRSNLLISEFRPDGVRFLSGFCAHRFVEQDGRWLIGGAAGQPDRLRSEPAQSEHRDLIIESVVVILRSSPRKRGPRGHTARANRHPWIPASAGMNGVCGAVEKSIVRRTQAERRTSQPPPNATNPRLALARGRHRRAVARRRLARR